MASANLVTAGFGSINPLIVAAAIIGAAAGCAEGATDEEILAAQVAWDDREVFELLQIIMQSGILK